MFETIDEPKDEPKEELRRQRSTRPSLFFPLLLIVIGVVFLLNNLGYLSGDFWGNLVLFWPVLLIAGGLDGIWRGEGVVGGALLAGLGVVFLAANLGTLAVDIWGLLLRVWPLFLVAWGIDIMIGRRSWLASLVGAVVILALFAGVLVWVGVGINPSAAVQGEAVSQELGEATDASIRLEPGAGSLHVDALAESGSLVEGTVDPRYSQNVTSEYSLDGTSATYTLRSSAVTIVYLGRDAAGWDWDLGLTKEIPLDLQVNLGAGEAELDLTGLQIGDLNVNLGVGQAVVTLPSEGAYNADISGAVGQVIVYVPEGLGVRLETNTGIAASQVPDGYTKVGSAYVSPGYDSAENRVDLHVGTAIGNLVVEER
jgi:hypothetical protein